MMNRIPKLLIRKRFSIATLSGAALFGIWMAFGISCQFAAGQAEDLDPELLAIINPKIKSAQPIDIQLAADSGLSVYSGEHLILFSDLRDDKKAEDLIRSYDAAVPQWCKYFGVDPEQAVGWKLRAHLLQGPGQVERFQNAKLILEPLPDFAAGYQLDHNIYLYDQPGDYYTRHLLLHEGTHAFMQWFLNGPGAPWYSEGMSELQAVHKKTKDGVTLLHRLKDRSEAPYWGRIKLIKDEFSAGQAMALDDVLAIPYNAFRNVRFYAWSWAACEFFNNHPLSQEAFRDLRNSTTLSYEKFNKTFKEKIKPDWKQLSQDWAIYIDEMEYGFDIAKGRITDAKQKPGGNEDAIQFSIAVDRSWQKTSIAVKAGDKFWIEASGRFRVGQTVVADEKSKSKNDDQAAEPIVYPWRSEADGITLEYYRGQPLGKLQAGILLDDAGPPEANRGDLTNVKLPPVVLPIPVGAGDKEIKIPANGLLCFRINESPAKMDDNQGALDVRCKRLQ
jgi:hypothetical protein